jgi:hypothetical protein
VAAKGARRRELPVNREDLDQLRRLKEWDSVINYFANDLQTLQDALIADVSDERRKFLAAKAQMADKYLGFALEAPKREG